MKKLLALVLAVAMTLSLTACGGGTKAAFDASKEAYDNVNAAYKIVEAFGDDIYEAWRMGIYDRNEDDFGLAYLAKKLNLTEKELQTGVAYMLNDDEWDTTMTDEEKESAIKMADTYFSLYLEVTDSVFSVCVIAVSYAYKATGKTAEAQEYLDAAKGQMKNLSEKYSDYEHYPSLKGYYTTTSSFFDFCQNPTGSFEQVKTTIDDYRNTARDYNSDLDYIFED